MSKVTARHRDRQAYVYVRQSSLAQVQHHRESTERQYNLRERAVTLGWAAEQVEVIDDDQGLSGASSTQRSGFQRLVSDVALGKVGAVFGLEASRLARSCADWYRLLEVAALSGTLIIDEDGIYDPNHYNDRLLLGLKGTLSEAELHFLKSRMMGGRRNKARRGAFRIRLPVGYVWDPEEEGIRMDPDERVRDAVHLFFRCFDRLGTAGAVARYFEDHRQPFPRRDGHGSLCVAPTWGALCPSRGITILRNPVYAGVYAYDRHSAHPEDPEEPAAGGRILIPSAHPGYISYERYERNVARLVGNRGLYNGMRYRGAPRHGRSLVHGIVLCGQCGRHMGVHYSADGAPSYSCRTPRTHRNCQFINGRHIDLLIEQVVLEALAPQELELAVGALEKLAQRASELDSQWGKRIEASRYEADKAARRYHQVEPENRLVVRTLESEWNHRLEELEDLEKDYEAARKKPPLSLSDQQRTEILALSQDLPRLWRAKTTNNCQRTEVVRLLVDDVTLWRIDEPWCIEVAIQWKTGVVTRHQAERVRQSPNATSRAVVTRIGELSADDRDDAEIAARLNDEGHRSGTGQRFTGDRVSSIRLAHGRRRRSHTTAQEAVARIEQLFASHTDAEIAEILTTEGYQTCNGRQFTSKVVFHLRKRQGLKKPGPRGLPRRGKMRA